jgi:hypothetical protein
VLNAHEPWQPAVGRRVRVQIDLACTYCAPGDSGLVGVVVRTGHTEDMLDEFGDRDFVRHHVWLRLDGSGRESHYMPSELEPL